MGFSGRGPVSTTTLTLRSAARSWYSIRTCISEGHGEIGNRLLISSICMGDVDQLPSWAAWSRWASSLSILEKRGRKATSRTHNSLARSVHTLIRVSPICLLLYPVNKCGRLKLKELGEEAGGIDYRSAGAMIQRFEQRSQSDSRLAPLLRRAEDSLKNTEM